MVRQGQIAEELGVEQQTVSNWETGRTIPVDHPERLAEVLNIDRLELLDLIAHAQSERAAEAEIEAERGQAAVRELQRFTDTYGQFHASYEEIVETVRLLAAEMKKLSRAVTGLARDVAEIKGRGAPERPPTKRTRKSQGGG